MPGLGLPEPPSPLRLLSRGGLTGGGIRGIAVSGSRGRARRERPHPPAPSPAAAGEGEKRIRGRAKPSPAPPNCRSAAASQWRPPPVSRGGGRGGETGSGEGQALPRTPGLPRRGGFPAELSPIPPGGRGAAASRQKPPLVSRDGIGEAAGSGEGLALPRSPGLPRRGRFPASSSLVRRREREKPAQGWALFSATPPGSRRRGRFPTDASPWQPSRRDWGSSRFSGGLDPRPHLRVAAAVGSRGERARGERRSPRAAGRAAGRREASRRRAQERP